MISSAKLNNLFLLIILFPFPSGFWYQSSLVCFFIFSLICLSSTNTRIWLHFSVTVVIITITVLINFYGLSNVSLASFKIFLITFCIVYCTNVKVYECRKSTYDFSNFVSLALYIEVFIVGVSLTGLESYLGLIYDQDKNSPVSLQTKFRVVGTFLNPNYLALFAVTALSFYYQKILFSRFRFLDTLNIALCLLLLFATGSRTGLVSAGVISVLFSLLYFNVQPIKMLLYSLVIVPFLPFLFGLLVDVKRFSMFLSISEISSQDQSLGARVQIWQEALEFFLEAPWFGYFISPVAISDNQFVQTILSFGLVYMFYVYIFLVLTFFRRVRYFAFGSSIFFTFSMTGSFFDNPKILFFFFLFILGASSYLSRDMSKRYLS